jgi:superfamily II DNA helicase RecQ
MNMGKKVNRVRVELDAGGIKQLSDYEIKTILRGADDLIMSGGRALLAKILAGSKDKKLLELELHQSPVYGAFKGQSQKEILAKIDWMILKRYLAIEYDYRLPLLVFTDKGWEIERETYADELLGKLEQVATNKEYEFVETLKDRDRGLILLLLDKIEDSKKKELITILEAWKMTAYNKVKVRIDEVINTLEKVEREDTPLEQKENQVVSFNALKKWRSIPEIHRKQIERNVFCSTCLDAVQIQNYTVKEDKGVISLHGQCRNCGNPVVRVVD